ncbi:MAG: hypothetical protein ACJA19_000086 [Bacteroidia bacterium]|jgi:hypothetical protein
MESNEIEICAFWAIDDPKKSMEYYQGREDVLTSYGFTSVVKSDFSWTHDSKVFVLSAYCKNEVIAGMKVHLKSINPLPLQTALNDRCDNLTLVLEKIGGDNYAEIGGVWNSKKFSGLRFPHVLARYSLAICKFLGLTSVFTFNASYTYKLSKNYGAELVDSLGKEGWFNYPTPKYKAAIWVFKDVQELVCLYEQDQERIEKLSFDPNIRSTKEREIPNYTINYYAEI